MIKVRTTLVALGLLLAMATPGRAEPFFGADTVFAPHSFGRPHGASIVAVKEGLLATWFSSKIETGSDATIYGSRWDKATGTWSKPFVIVNHRYSKSLGNTALFRDDDGLIWLFFAAVRMGGWSGSMVDYKISRDDGHTFSRGKNLVAWPGNMPRNPPVKVGDHTMLVPLYTEFWEALDIIGAYTVRLRYKEGEIVEEKVVELDDKSAIQPALVPLPDGRTLLLARDKDELFIRRSYSPDGGRTWAPVEKTDISNPGSAVAALYVEEIKAIIMVYNHSQDRRNLLSMAVSYNNGKSFRRFANLARNVKDEWVTYAYPAITRDHDGMIHIIWSHDNRATLKHVWFNAEWLNEYRNRRTLLPKMLFPDGE